MGIEKTEMIKDFESWAKDNRVSRPSNYGTFLNSLKKPDCFGEFEDIYTIEDFYNSKDFLYASTYCTKLLKEFKETKPETKDPNYQKWYNSHSAIVKLLMFLSSKGITCNTGDSPGRDKTRKQINKPDIHKIDGIEGLIAKNGIVAFVKMAVEQSYFFDPEIVISRHDELCDMFADLNGGALIPARTTTKSDMERGNYYLTVTKRKKNKPIEGIYYINEENIHIPVGIDSDGNAQVRQTIKRFTGYTVCEGEESIFQNYIISHIWGNAFDPRYFTSLWNIVLIPAWANPLMDKINPDEGAPASILQSTFQFLCTKVYLKKIKNWDKILLKGCPSITHPKDSIKQDYSLNIIKERVGSKNTSLVGPVIQKKLHNLCNSSSLP